MIYGLIILIGVLIVYILLVKEDNDNEKEIRRLWEKYILLKGELLKLKK